MGFPLLPPSAAGKSANSAGGFSQGVNFAVAGATAVDISYLVARGVSNPSTNVSLGTQLEWFKQMLPSLCNTPSSKLISVFHCTDIISKIKFYKKIKKNQENKKTEGCKILNEFWPNLRGGFLFSGFHGKRKILKKKHI